MDRRQRIFDVCATHLIKQGKQSLEHGDCAYFGENNLGCAARPFLKDEVEKIKHIQNENGIAVNNLGFRNFSTTYPNLIKDEFQNPTTSELDVICKLQDIHDMYYVGNWEMRLTSLAEEQSLNTDALEAAIKERDESNRICETA